jgi:hypothetical protein
MPASYRNNVLAGLGALLLAPLALSTGSNGAIAPLPETLRGTGLYVAGSSTEIDPKNLAFSPQYPLWTDGMSKRRWLHLPAGTFIDASQPDAWKFPVGTRLWKEFSHGRRVETRFIERVADGSWRFASYVWNADGSDAVLAPADGIGALPVPSAPNGRHAVPSRTDCLACHDDSATPVIGVSALQLSPDRDPLARGASACGASDVDLAVLVQRGLVRHLPESLQQHAPRIVAASPTERAALGYLHGNCGHCHNDSGALAGVELSLAQRAGDARASVARTLVTLVGHDSRFRGSAGAASAQRVVPGSAQNSVLNARMTSNSLIARMPPLGVSVPDAEGIALVGQWINGLAHQQEIAR